MLYISNKEYEDWVDALKGIAIILVIAGHSNIPTLISNIIYFFHMPLFFLLSGYLEKKREQSFKSVFEKKVKRLIYPYFTFGILIIAWNTLKNVNHTENFTILLLKRFIALLYGNFIWENNYEYIGTLWFLVALFSVSLIGNIVNRIKQRELRILVSCITVAIGIGICYFEKLFKLRLPWCLDIALIAFAFYQIGIELRNDSKIETYFKSMVALLAIIVLGVICGRMNIFFMQKNTYEMIKVDMLYMNYGFVPLFILSASLISVGLCGVLRKICEIKRFVFMEKVGKQSLTIMVVHLYIMQVVYFISGKLSSGINCWIVFVLTTIISVILSLFMENFLSYIYNFNKLKELIKSCGR